MVNPNLIEKIKKLLALATSANENEATAAAEKASLLLAQYNLSLADLGTEEQENVAEAIVETTARTKTWKMILLSGIAEANGCEALRRNYTGSTFLLGTPTNLMVCHQLYDYLTSAIERQANVRKGKGRAYLNGFRVGCATRVSQRLMAQRQELESLGIQDTEETPMTPAIVVRSMFDHHKQMIADYLQQQGVKVKTRALASVSSEAGYNSGYQVGDQINLHQQVRSSQGREQLEGTDLGLIQKPGL